MVIKMKKRLYLSLVVIAALLSGCGKEKTTESVETISSEQQTEIAEESTEQQTEAVEQSTEVVMDDETAFHGDEEMNMLNSFVEEKAGKDTFTSFDELISYLQPGQAYAYVDVRGAEEPLLLVTEQTYDNMDGNQVSINAYIYMKNDNGVQYASAIASDGTAYPLALGDGLLYQAGNHTVGTQCVSTDTHAIMYMAYVYEETDETANTEHYGGFVRTENDFSGDEEEIDTDSPETMQKLMEDYGKAEVINFKVVQ